MMDRTHRSAALSTTRSRRARTVGWWPVLAALLLPGPALAVDGDVPGVVQRIEVGLGPRTTMTLRPGDEPGVYLLEAVRPPTTLLLELRAHQRDLLTEVQAVGRKPELLQVRLRLARADLLAAGVTLAAPRRFLIEIGDRYLLQGGIGDARLAPLPMPLLPSTVHPARPSLEDEPLPAGSGELRQVRLLAGRGRAGEAMHQLEALLPRLRAGSREGIDALYLQGRLLDELDGGPAQAEQRVRVLGRALSLDPHHPSSLLARMLLAQAHVDLGQPEQAAAAYLQCINAGPASPYGGICRIEAAFLALSRGAFQQAEDLLRPYPAAGSGPAAREAGGGATDELAAYAQLIRGLLALRRGQPDLARSQLGTLLAGQGWIGHRHPELYLTLAELLLADGEDALAEPIYRQLAAWQPPLPFIDRVELRLGDLLERQGDDPGAKARWLRTAMLRSGSVGALLCRLRLQPPQIEEPALTTLLVDTWSGRGDASVRQEAGARLALRLWREDRFAELRQLLNELERAFPAHPLRQSLGWLWARAVYLSYAAPAAAGRPLQVADRYLRDGRSLRGRPGELGLLLLVSRSQAALGLHAEAALTLQEQLPRFEGQAEEQTALRLLIESFLRQGKEFHAGKVLDYLRLRHPDPEAPAELARLEGELAALRGDRTAEEEAWRRYLQAGGGEPRLQARLGHLLLARGEALAAQPLLAGALAGLPGPGLPLSAGQLWAVAAGLDLGQALLAVHQPAQAARIYALVASWASKTPGTLAEASWARLRQGEALRRAGDAPGALAVWRQEAKGPGAWSQFTARAAAELSWDAVVKTWREGDGAAGTVSGGTPAAGSAGARAADAP